MLTEKQKISAKEANRRYREKNVEKLRAASIIYNKKHKDKLAEYNKKWYREHKEEVKEYGHNRHLRLKDLRNKQSREWNKNNKERRNLYNRSLRAENPMFKLYGNVSRGIRSAIKENKKGRQWESLVDYTLEDLKKHLENNFKEGMTWQNQGSYWDIDHRIPNSWFIYEKPEDNEFKLAWSLENLQPKIEKDNHDKKDLFAEPTENQLVTYAHILKRRDNK